MSLKFKHVLVTGGTGYVGSLLVPQLLEQGYKVSVYDTMYFGDERLFPKSPQVKAIKGDIRDTDSLFEAMAGVDAVINLACISNDASFELDEKLSTTINLDAFEPMVIAAKKAGVKRFVYASSSSVYGVSESPDVTEDHPLVPLTLYNKYKGMCEPLLFKHQSRDFVCVTHCVGDAVKRAEGINRYLWNNKRRFQKDMKRAVNFMDKLLTLAVVTTRSRR